MSEITEIAGDSATSNKKVRITPRHIQLAIRQDSEFAKLLGEVIIPSSGVHPNINPALLPTLTVKQKVKVAQTAKPTKKPGTSGTGATTDGAGPSNQAPKTKKTKKIVLTGGKKRKNQNET